MKSYKRWLLPPLIPLAFFPSLPQELLLKVTPPWAWVTLCFLSTLFIRGHLSISPTTSSYLRYLKILKSLSESLQVLNPTLPSNSRSLALLCLTGEFLPSLPLAPLLTSLSSCPSPNSNKMFSPGHRWVPVLTQIPQDLPGHTSLATFLSLTLFPNSLLQCTHDSKLSHLLGNRLWWSS